MVSGPAAKPVVEVEYQYEKKILDAEEVSSMVLAKMVEFAETYVAPQKIDGAVITVPAYFNDSQRQCGPAAAPSAFSPASAMGTKMRA